MNIPMIQLRIEDHILMTLLEIIMITNTLIIGDYNERVD